MAVDCVVRDVRFAADKPFVKRCLTRVEGLCPRRKPFELPCLFSPVRLDVLSCGELGIPVLHVREISHFLPRSEETLFSKENGNVLLPFAFHFLVFIFFCLHNAASFVGSRKIDYLLRSRKIFICANAPVFRR